jgi:hypothetical protein
VTPELPQSRAVFAIVVVVVLGWTLPLQTGCAAAAASQPSTVAFSTHADPPPYTPEPSDQPTAGETTGIAASDARDQARAVVARFIDAVQASDQGELERLFADPITPMGRRREPRIQEREALIAFVLEAAQQQPGPAVGVQEIANLRDLSVTPLSESYGEDLPTGLAPTDLLVTFPVDPQGGRNLRAALGWLANGMMVIRPGRQPRIVGI